MKLEDSSASRRDDYAPVNVEVVAERRNGPLVGRIEVKNCHAQGRAYCPGRGRHINLWSDSIPDLTLQATALQIHLPHPEQ